MRFLAHDLLEGRAPGTRGGRLAAEYLASQFAVAGALPAGEKGTYFQEVPLVSVRVRAGAILRIRGGRGGEPIDLVWLEDFVGIPGAREAGEVSLSAPLVFVGSGGFGSESAADPPGAAKIQGKVVVAFAEPPPGRREKGSPGGKSSGRLSWRQKLEAARRAGAAGTLLIHSEEASGYPWEAVRATWGREAVGLEEDARTGLRFAGWLSWEAGQRLLTRAGHSAEALWKLESTQKPLRLPLKLEIQMHIPLVTRRLRSANAVAMIPGSAPERRQETVVFLAHWDHLGTRAEGEDRVYNGAVDNATGCAALLELARLWASLEKEPARTALFLAVTAGEPVEAGSRWYVRHPLMPLEKTRLLLSFDSLLPVGVPASVAVAGPADAGVWAQIRDAARRLRLPIESGSGQDNGFCASPYWFVQAGVAAYRVRMGARLAGRRDSAGAALWRSYLSRDYHRPTDEFHADWDCAALARIVEFAFLAGRMAADLP